MGSVLFLGFLNRFIQNSRILLSRRSASEFAAVLKAIVKTYTHEPLDHEKEIRFTLYGVPLYCREDELLHLIGEFEITKQYPDLPLHKNARVMDVGANVGAFTLQYGSTNTDATFYCFEPVPASFALLKKNTRALGARVKAYNKALSNDGKPIKIYLADNLCNSAVQKSQKWISVPSEKFEKALARVKPSVVKMDIEGMEYELLTGSALKRIPLLFVEIHDFFGEKKKDALLKRIKDAGLTCFYEDSATYAFSRSPQKV